MKLWAVQPTLKMPLALFGPELSAIITKMKATASTASVVTNQMKLQS